MSIQESQTVDCPACQKPIAIEIYRSLNPSRQPGALDAILKDTLQGGQCECGQKVRLEPEFAYMDLKNKMAIGAWPADALGAWRDYQTKTKASFDLAFASTSLGDGVQTRITFGWPALKEKVFAQQNGISDVDLEVAKVVVIKESGEVPQLEATLRLVDMRDDKLIFAWYQGGAPVPAQGGLSVDKSMLDEIRDNPEKWAELSGAVNKGLFIDLYRVFHDEN